jgi:iron complex transport system substrate-binding protein
MSGYSSMNLQLGACLFSVKHPFSIVYGDLNISGAFLADVIVEGKVIIELKFVEKLAPVHSKQLLTYLRLSKMKLGLLVNFGGSIRRQRN